MIRRRLLLFVALIAILDRLFKGHTLAEWTQKLNDAEMTWAPGLEPLEAASHPQAVENGFFIDAQHAAIGAYKLLTFPFRMSAAKPRFRNAAPEQGAHTREILTDLGYSSEQIDAFGAKGVVSY